MRRKVLICFGLVLLFIQFAMSTTQSPLQQEDEYYQDTDLDEEAIESNDDNEAQQPQYLISDYPGTAGLPVRDRIAYLVGPESTTDCGFSFMAKIPEKAETSPSTEKEAAESTTASGETDEISTTTAPTTTTPPSPPTTSPTSPTSPISPKSPISPTTPTSPISPTTPTSAPVSGTATTKAAGEIPSNPSAPENNGEQEVRTQELRILVQHLYISQARVQLEAGEIKKSEAVANVAQMQLEEAANHVRAVTAALQNAQHEVASAAIRAQIAQLQLAAHDQLLFAARQDVDALSSQMVGLQAAESMAAPTITFDLIALLEKLKQPLSDDQKPTPVPRIIPMPSHAADKGGKVQLVSLQDLNRE